MNQTRTPANVEINGATIRHLRVHNGFGVTALARELGCSPAYVSRMESGRAKRVSPAMFAKLRAALAVIDPRVLMAKPGPRLDLTLGLTPAQVDRLAEMLRPSADSPAQARAG
jgi:transcriptional regulator with XRE-family HTH domain